MEQNMMLTRPTIDMWNLIRRLSEITPEARNMALLTIDAFVNGLVTQENLSKSST